MQGVLFKSIFIRTWRREKGKKIPSIDQSCYQILYAKIFFLRVWYVSRRQNNLGHRFIHPSININDRSIPALIVPSGFNSELAGYVKTEFNALDQWLEIHFSCVNVLPNGRCIKVKVDGVVLADTGSKGRVMSLSEAKFPSRWYLPPTAMCVIGTWTWTMLGPLQVN